MIQRDRSIRGHARDLTVSGARPLGERLAGVPARLEKAVPIGSSAGKVEVR